MNNSTFAFYGEKTINLLKNGNLTFSFSAILVGSIGNFTVLVLFFIERKRLKIPHLYMISMATCDFFHLFLSLPLVKITGYILEVKADDLLCKIATGVSFAFVYCCLMSVSLTVLDRYWSVIHVVHYQNNASIKQTKCEFILF